ncbi:MAG: hypothetical protein AAFZ09_18365, partial [Pseudomonadota bacterium]
MTALGRLRRQGLGDLAPHQEVGPLDAEDLKHIAEIRVAPPRPLGQRRPVGIGVERRGGRAGGQDRRHDPAEAGLEGGDDDPLPRGTDSGLHEVAEGHAPGISLRPGQCHHQPRNGDAGRADVEALCRGAEIGGDGAQVGLAVGAAAGGRVDEGVEAADPAALGQHEEPAAIGAGEHGFGDHGHGGAGDDGVDRTAAGGQHFGPGRDGGLERVEVDINQINWRNPVGLGVSHMGRVVSLVQEAT